jgi:hypothetical protein
MFKELYQGLRAILGTSIAFHGIFNGVFGGKFSGFYWSD